VWINGQVRRTVDAILGIQFYGSAKSIQAFEKDKKLNFCSPLIHKNHFNGSHIISGEDSSFSYECDVLTLRSIVESLILDANINQETDTLTRVAYLNAHDGSREASMLLRNLKEQKDYASPSQSILSLMVMLTKKMSDVSG